MPPLEESNGEESDSESNSEDEFRKYVERNTQTRKKVRYASPLPREKKKYKSSFSSGEIKEALDRVRQVRRVGEAGNNPTYTLQGLISTKLGQRLSTIL